MFGFIQSKIRSLQDSEDLLQEVYVQTLSNLNVLDTIDNLTGWLYTVAKNKIIDWYRKKRLPTVSIDKVDENGISLMDLLPVEMPEYLDETDRDSIYQTTMDGVEELPESQKFVFVHQVLAGKTFRELAEETGESINTLIARKRYAIRFLQNRIRKRF